MFPNDHHVLSQCNTQLRLLYLLSNSARLSSVVPYNRVFVIVGFVIAGCHCASQAIGGMTTSFPGSLRKKSYPENEVGKVSVAFNHQRNKDQA